MDLGLVGRRAVVTGASAGIGREIAWALAREGVQLLLVARREESLRELAAQLVAADLPISQIDHASHLAPRTSTSHLDLAPRAREPQWVSQPSRCGRTVTT